MKYTNLLFAVPVVAALAMAPQLQQGEGAADPAADQAHVVSLSELQYTTLSGEVARISARNLVEMRLIEDHAQCIRLELYYENTDYSLVDVQGFQLLRKGQMTREVRLVRGKKQNMRFPKGLH